MTYDDWCKNSTRILKEAESVNKWADKAKEDLLINIGPRLANLDESGYMGMGFHYSLEQTFGRLIDGLSLPWQPCANWCNKIEDDRLKFMGLRVSYRCLLDSIKKAEKSIPKFKKIMKKL